MPIMNVNHAKFYYELHGKGEPLVLIAGLKADHTGWFPVLDKLATQYNVLIFDNRGTGQTIDSDEAFSVETMADDVIGLIQMLNLNRPHIVGHSLGGAIAQVIAKNHSEKIRSVALCNTFLRFNDTGREVFTNTLSLYQANASQADIMDSIVPWVFSPTFLNPEIIEIIRKASNENFYPQSLSGYARQLKALYDFDSRSWVDSINIPTLILGSAEDKVATFAESQALAKHIRNSKLVNIPSSHASQVEQPELFIDLLSNFFQTQCCQ